MLKRDKRGYYVANSLEQLAELYKQISSTQDEKTKLKEQKIRDKAKKKGKTNNL